MPVTTFTTPSGKPLTWEDSDIASQALVEPMLEDMFEPLSELSGNEAKAWLATKAECIRMLNDEDSQDMVCMEMHASPFFEGYLRALKEANH